MRKTALVLSVFSLVFAHPKAMTETKENPPKGKVGRSIRLWGATGHKSFAILAKP